MYPNTRSQRRKGSSLMDTGKEWLAKKSQNKAEYVKETREATKSRNKGMINQ